ncbi:MAG: nitroreductase family protein [Planctomycetota bacterium]
MSRHPDADVDPQFVERWSPRSFASEPLPDTQVRALFEAARWAPSCFNEQPWRFVYAMSPSGREQVAALLADANRAWAAKAPLLGVVFARRRFARNDKPNRWAAFDSGAAAFSLALQAHRLGLAAHFMGGFDENRAYQTLGVDEAEFEAMAAFAVGCRGDVEALPEALQAREAPSDRKPPGEVAVRFGD